MRPRDHKPPEFEVNGLSKEVTHKPTEGPLEGWTLTGGYDLVGARLVLTSLEIQPRSAEIPQNGITGALLRRIRPALLLDAVRSYEEGWLEWLEKGLAKAAPSADEPGVQRIHGLINEAKDLTTAPRSGPTGVRGRPPLDNEFLRQVAQQHIDEINSGGRYGAIQRLADRYGAPYNTAKSWAKKARQRGLYPTGETAAQNETE